MVKAALTALGGGDESPVLFLNENGVQLLIGGDFSDSNASQELLVWSARKFEFECRKH